MFDVAAAQAARGHDVSFFGTAHVDNLPLELNPFLPRRREFGVGKGTPGDALAAIWSREAARKLAVYVARFEPDVAHLHNIAYHLTPAVIPTLARAGVPTVMTLHDYNLLCPNHYFFSAGEPCFRCPEGQYGACITRRCVKGRLGASTVGYAAHFAARISGAYHKVARLLAPSRFMLSWLAKAGFTPPR